MLHSALHSSYTQQHLQFPDTTSPDIPAAFTSAEGLSPGFLLHVPLLSHPCQTIRTPCSTYSYKYNLYNFFISKLFMWRTDNLAASSSGSTESPWTTADPASATSFSQPAVHSTHTFVHVHSNSRKYREGTEVLFTLFFKPFVRLCMFLVFISG